MMGNLLNHLIGFCFGTEYMERNGTAEELEPLLTREYLQEQIEENRTHFLSVLENRLHQVNNHFEDLHKEAENIKTSVECTKIEFDSSEAELRESLVDTIQIVDSTNTRIRALESNVNGLETRIQELESDDTTKKLREIFSKSQTPEPWFNEIQSEPDVNDF